VLISIVLTLTTDRSATLPAELGRANYTALLARLHRMNPALAAEVHDGNGPKPLTCSGILNPDLRGENVTVRPGRAYHVRVTGLTERISEALAAVLLAHPPSDWDIGHHPFAVQEITCDPARHPWAGESSYAALAQRIEAHHERHYALPRTVQLEFSSPTAFRSQEMLIPAPMPALVFGSLLDRWHAFGGLPLDPETRAFTEQAVAISDYHLESRRVPHRDGAFRVGGVGRVAYTLRSTDPYRLAVMGMLADYAFYSGVGVQTASGMGQCRRIP
jgi:CRISPR-associated endoribonuclease Cas6